MRSVFVIFFLFPLLLNGKKKTDPSPPPTSSLQTLYYTLDPSSVVKHLAFYELYPDTPEGKESLHHAWTLLSKNNPTQLTLSLIHLPRVDVTTVLKTLSPAHADKPPPLQEEELSFIAMLSQHLPHKKLQGSQATSRQQVLKLPTEEIDLARALLLDQLEHDKDALSKITQYEATLDLIALLIQARLPQNATGLQKVEAINTFIFHEMQFRFPPHSIYAKEIDLYTFLPSVLDNREGVCLGVCILYLSLAQRLDLPLEIITPPGHIYLRYQHGDTYVNIETTARGIDLPSETYLSIPNRSLSVRTLKEVVGMAFMNAAALCLAQEKYHDAVALYEKAQCYVGRDPLLKMLLGCSYLFVNKKALGEKLLKSIPDAPFEHAVSKETIPEDLLLHKIHPEGVRILFLPVDETRQSIIAKQIELQQILKKYPAFRAGIFMLATTWLQLGNTKEALILLQRYHELDPTSVTVEYYLAILSMERMDYKQAWYFLKNTERLSFARDHHPQALLALRMELQRRCPE